MSKSEKILNTLKIAYEELNQLKIEVPSIVQAYGIQQARSIIRERYKAIEKLRKKP